jgi:L-2,4-diaminobutyrate decarboxylase
MSRFRPLIDDGRAIVARTTVDGVTSLKFTLLNPTTTLEDVGAMLDIIRECAQSIAGREVAE